MNIHWIIYLVKKWQNCKTSKKKKKRKVTRVLNKNNRFSTHYKIYESFTFTELNNVQFYREHQEHTVFFGIIFRGQRLRGHVAQDKMLDPLNDRK